MKHLDPNDPRFTAKALGENEAQDIHPEAREEFTSLQSFADELKSDLKAHDDSEALTEEQKERIRSAVEKKRKKILRFPVWVNAVAACLVLGIVVVISTDTLNNSDDSYLFESVVPPEEPLQSQEVSHVDPNQGLVEDRLSGAVAGQSSASPTVLEEKLNQLRDEFQNGRETQSLETFTVLDLEAPVRDDRDAYRFGQSADGNDIATSDNLPGERTSGSLVGRGPSAPDAEFPKIALRPMEEGDVALRPSLSGTRIQNEIRIEETEAQDTSYVVTQTLGGKRTKADLSKAGADASTSESKPQTEPEAQPSFAAAPATLRRNREPESNLVFNYADTPQTLVTHFRQRQEPWNREAYDRLVENTFKNPKDHPLSTFSIDVDTASYANLRRFLNSGHLPPADAVRIEEMVNYFSYDYAEPTDETPFAVHVDSATAPWNEDHRLVRIALQGDTVDESERPDANLVFLIDVSGSMSPQNKLPLVQRSLNLLVDQMEARDRIAVVVYAGASGLALPSTTANNKETIQHAISNLKSGGSTNGGAGITLAYSVAQKHFIEGGINRVILCTDGDFNVGTTNRGSLTRMIEQKAKTGVFFSVLGFGMGNYQDATMEELSNKGNGNYGYVDSFKEARKVFVDDMLGTLYTIAKDVKIQVEFNPQQVGSYRLIGYENRMLAKEDFNDDTKDAGEIGAGHRVTALYEIVPPGLAEGTTPSVDPLKYQAATDAVVKSSEMLTVKLRYKQPDEDVSQLIEQAFIDNDSELDAADTDFRFVTAVAGFGMLLRQSELIADMNFQDVLSLAQKAKGNDTGGLRSEFIELVEKAISLIPEEETASSPEPEE